METLQDTDQPQTTKCGQGFSRRGVKVSLGTQVALGKKPVQSEMVEFIAKAVEIGTPFAEFQHMLEQAFVAEALRQARGNACKAALQIKTHRNTIARHAKRVLVG